MAFGVYWHLVVALVEVQFRENSRLAKLRGELFCRWQGVLVGDDGLVHRS